MKHSNRSETTPWQAASPGRRTWLVGTGAAVAAAAFVTAGRLGAPAGSPGRLGVGSAWAEVAPRGGGLDAFLVLSQRLTGRERFDPLLAQRVYDALDRSDPAFRQNVARLNAWVQTHGGVPSDIYIEALQVDQLDLANAVVAMVRAWYLGLVGELPRVQVVAYERALMFDTVSDVLPIPSYCRDVPFYWTQKPGM